MSFELLIGIFLVCIIIGRVLSERALRKLTPEQKVKLIDAFSSQRAYSYIPLAVLILAFFGASRFTSAPQSILTGTYWVGLLAYVVFSFEFGRRRMSTLELPAEYLRGYGIARAFQLLGVGVILVGVFAGAV